MLTVLCRLFARSTSRICFRRYFRVYLLFVICSLSQYLYEEYSYEYTRYSIPSSHASIHTRGSQAQFPHCFRARVCSRKVRLRCIPLEAQRAVERGALDAVAENPSSGRPAPIHACARVIVNTALMPEGGRGDGCCWYCSERCRPRTSRAAASSSYARAADVSQCAQALRSTALSFEDDQHAVAAKVESSRVGLKCALRCIAFIALVGVEDRIEVVKW